MTANNASHSAPGKGSQVDIQTFGRRTSGGKRGEVDNVVEKVEIGEHDATLPAIEMSVTLEGSYPCYLSIRLRGGVKRTV